MPKDLFIRGLDDEIHKKIAATAERKGVSLNSLLKDVVDKWIEKDTEVPPRHELILYSDEKALASFLKSIDYSSSEKNMARICCGSKHHEGIKYLKKHGWLDGTLEPYKEFLEKPNQYVEKILKKVGPQLRGKSLFGLMFLSGDLFENKSLNDAVRFCQWYDEKKIPGNTFCLVNLKTLPSENLELLLDFFSSHNQVFIVRPNGFFKIHLSEESIHKIFLN